MILYPIFPNTTLMACKEQRSPVATRNSFKVRSLFLGQQGPHPLLVGTDNHRLAPAEPIPWSDVAGVTALLQ